MRKRAIGQPGGESLSDDQPSESGYRKDDDKAQGVEGQQKQQWKDGFTNFLNSRAKGTQGPSSIRGVGGPVDKGQTNKTLWGSTDSGVPGGLTSADNQQPAAVRMPTVETMTPPQTPQAGQQPIANPGGVAHNQPTGLQPYASVRVKESAMSQKTPAVSEERKELVRQCLGTQR